MRASRRFGRNLDGLSMILLDKRSIAFTLPDYQCIVSCTRGGGRRAVDDAVARCQSLIPKIGTRQTELMTFDKCTNTLVCRLTLTNPASQRSDARSFKLFTN